MSHNPNTIKSFDDINEGGRKSDVLIEAIEKAERLQKQLDIAVKCMREYLRGGCYPLMEKKLKEIEELNNPCQNCTYTDEYCASGDCKRT